MSAQDNNSFSDAVNIFHNRRLPEKAVPVGYAALIREYDLSVPIAIKLSAISIKHRIYEENNWRIFTPRHKPDNSLEGHLIFALKYEGLDLLILKRLFEAILPQNIEDIVRRKPTSSYVRRIWFLYEWLLDRKLALDDVKTGNYVDVVNTKQQYSVSGTAIARYRVRNNLPGSREFCPLVFKTKIIEQYVNENLANQVNKTIANISPDILARAASFLLLKDSKSSYVIEGEEPQGQRVQRWSREISQAGKHDLNKTELLRLQKVVLGKSRFIKFGFRSEDGFVGIHERESRLPVPDHISARAEDLDDLMSGIYDFIENFSGNLDPVIAAAILAFGFIYIHPFEDGNGRIHRYLIHHVLTRQKFSPAGIVFPVSAVILECINEYKAVLESYSSKILPLIKWKVTTGINVKVLNDSSDFYRYFDATLHVEFLYSCVRKTIKTDLPQEAALLKSYDLFKGRIKAFIEMPDSKIDLLFNFLEQSGGHLSRRALKKEFATLEEDEVVYIEKIYAEIFKKSVYPK